MHQIGVGAEMHQIEMLPSSSSSSPWSESGLESPDWSHSPTQSRSRWISPAAQSRTARASCALGSERCGRACFLPCWPRPPPLWRSARLDAAAAVEMSSPRRRRRVSGEVDEWRRWMVHGWRRGRLHGWTMRRLHRSIGPAHSQFVSDICSGHFDACHLVPPREFSEAMLRLKARATDAGRTPWHVCETISVLNMGLLGHGGSAGLPLLVEPGKPVGPWQAQERPNFLVSLFSKLFL